MSRVWVTSDLHLGHNNICKYRTDFSSPEDHHETMVTNTLDILSKRDVLWLLGDICFSRDWMWFYDEVIKKAQIVNLVLGNHDTDNQERRDIVKYAASIGVKIFSLTKYKDSWLSHAPIHPCELRGKFCVHGHMHREVVDDSRYFNACVEHTGWKPVSYQDIVEQIRKNTEVVR